MTGVIAGGPPRAVIVIERGVLSRTIEDYVYGWEPNRFYGIAHALEGASGEVAWHSAAAYNRYLGLYVYEMWLWELREMLIDLNERDRAFVLQRIYRFCPGSANADDTAGWLVAHGDDATIFPLSGMQPDMKYFIGVASIPAEIKIGLEGTNLREVASHFEYRRVLAEGESEDRFNSDAAEKARASKRTAPNCTSTIRNDRRYRGDEPQRRPQELRPPFDFARCARFAQGDKCGDRG